MARIVEKFVALEDMSERAAEIISAEAEAAIRERGLFSFCLSGGKTPRLLYEILGERYVRKIQWKDTFFFWSDERFVPHDHPDSNYRMAREAMLDKAGIYPENIHVVPIDETPRESAADYERDLRTFFEGARHTFDMILLGMGPDGHTASLFPGHRALNAKTRWVDYVQESPLEPHVPRITLTLPCINAARFGLFLVSAQGKEKAVEAILEDDDSLPAAMVNTQKLTWLIAFP